MSEVQQTEYAPTHVAAISDDGTLRAWLEDQARRHGLTTLLAHADDGVIWGRFDAASGTLTTADSAFSELARLRLFTLQQCRAFGSQGEVLLWRDDHGCRARLISEQDGTSARVALWQSDGWQPQACDYGAEETISEEQILWGTQSKGEHDGFTLLADGKQGLCHAVPLIGIPFDTRDTAGDVSDGKRHRPVRLSVRHYIDYNGDGVARIALSRLVALKPVSRE